MGYDAIIDYLVILTGVTYCGYAFYINDIIRDGYGLTTSGNSISITRSFNVKKGDKIKLELNNVGTSGGGHINL